MLKRKVIVFRTKILPYSETFIKEQVLACQLWDSVLVGHFLIRKGLDITGVDYITLENKVCVLTELKRNILKLIKFSPRKDFCIINSLRPELIHVHFGVDLTINWSLLKKFNVPILVTLHGYDITISKEWWHSGKEGIHLKHYPEELLRISRNDNVHFVAVSEAIKDKAILFGIPAEKIHVKHIGIDTSQFNLSDIPFAERKQILFIGRLVDKKGCKVLLDAFARIYDKFPDHELKIIGDGPLKITLEKYAQDRSLNVKFMGACPKEIVIHELVRTSVFCLPSVQADNGDAEGFGLVLLEAAASGVPVVTSALGGSTEGVIHGKTGFSFPEHDSLQLASYLEELLSNVELMSSMGLAGRKFVEENFNILTCTASLEQLYDELVIHNS
ncbi:MULTISPECIES: glycosyltransferase [Enterobacterales]|uniref:glycosyltransferase n=1 Tax=Enterobacterales TaxID=91347 RepID=UPI002EDAE54E